MPTLRSFPEIPVASCLNRGNAPNYDPQTRTMLQALKSRVWGIKERPDCPG